MCFNCKVLKKAGEDHGSGKCTFNPWQGETEELRTFLTDIRVDPQPAIQIKTEIKEEPQDEDDPTPDPTPGTSRQPEAAADADDDLSSSSSPVQAADLPPADPTFGFLPGPPDDANVRLAQHMNVSKTSSSSSSSRQTGDPSDDSGEEGSSSDSSGDEFEAPPVGEKKQKKKKVVHKTTKKYFKQQYTVSITSSHRLLVLPCVALVVA